MKGFPLIGLLFGFWVTTINKVLCPVMILGEKVLIEVFTSLGHCAGLVGSKLLMFQDNVLAPSARVTHFWIVLLLKMGHVFLALVTNCHPTLHNIPKVC